MASAAQRDDKIVEETGQVDAGYDAWKRAKIERALTQSRDRDAMIPIEELWRDLSLEG